jgi:KDO2-lipid IV(A) lauroyltransferase
MQFVIFILVYPIIWFISLFPLRVLYVFSDFIYLLIYYVFGYRKKVVYQNLKLAYPNKSEKDIKKIQKKFFHHFVDIFIEMIKSFTISKKEILKRYRFPNIEVMNNLEKNGKSIILMGSHYGNWEWIITLNKFISFKGFAAYTKINNTYFDKKVRDSRERLGANFVETFKFIPFIEKNKENNILSIYGLLSDQSPQLQKAKYFTEFMGTKVPVHTGAEFLAKKYDHSVILMKTKKIKRGYYETIFKVLAENPNEYKNYEITDLFLRELEGQINEKPEHYFWSHKRWKHKGKEPRLKTKD